MGRGGSILGTGLSGPSQRLLLMLDALRSAPTCVAWERSRSLLAQGERQPTPAHLVPSCSRACLVEKGALAVLAVGARCRLSLPPEPLPLSEAQSLLYPGSRAAQPC